MLLENISRIDGNTLLTYGLLGLTSVVLAVVTIYDKEDVDDDITPQEESVMPSFDSILPSSSYPLSLENTSMTPSAPEMNEFEEKVENMGGKCKSKKRKTIKKKSKAKK